MSNTATTSNPLDLPEIRLVLADVLPLHTLTVCARVNKEWYRSFMPPLWRHTSLRVDIDKAGSPSAKVTTLKLATKHKEFIHNLSIIDFNLWRVRQRKELWSAMSAFPVLRSLTLQQTYDTQTVVKSESIQLLKPRFLHLTTVDFHPNINLASESYEEIMSSCPQLRTLRGGNVKALVLTEGRPWVCTLLRLWSLCLDFGTIEDYRGKITDAATGSSDSASTSSSLEKNIGQQVERLRKEVRRQLFERMSLLVNLETVDFRKMNPKGLCQPLHVDHNGSGLDCLLQCPRLKEVRFDWDDSNLETCDWIKTQWLEIKVNSPPVLKIEEDEFEDADNDDSEYESDLSSTESDEYGYRRGRGPYCAKCDEHGCSHYAEVLEIRHEERHHRHNGGYSRRYGRW